MAHASEKRLCIVRYLFRLKDRDAQLKVSNTLSEPLIFERYINGSKENLYFLILHKYILFGFGWNYVLISSEVPKLIILGAL
jgi:hypothetical protein